MTEPARLARARAWGRDPFGVEWGPRPLPVTQSCRDRGLGRPLASAVPAGGPGPRRRAVEKAAGRPGPARRRRRASAQGVMTPDFKFGQVIQLAVTRPPIMISPGSEPDGRWQAPESGPGPEPGRAARPGHRPRPPRRLPAGPASEAWHGRGPRCTSISGSVSGNHDGFGRRARSGECSG